VRFAHASRQQPLADTHQKPLPARRRNPQHSGSERADKCSSMPCDGGCARPTLTNPVKKRKTKTGSRRRPQLLRSPSRHQHPPSRLLRVRCQRLAAAAPAERRGLVSTSRRGCGVWCGVRHNINQQPGAPQQAQLYEHLPLVGSLRNSLRSLADSARGSCESAQRGRHDNASSAQRPTGAGVLGCAVTVEDSVRSG
jgi:hypothetical protein